jgi:hypothetical protein
MKSIVMGILVIGLALMGTMSVADQGGQSMKTLGKVTVIKRDKATIHSYMAPEDSALVTSQIIETRNNLVVVDAQFLRPYAKDLYNYIKSLNKPVERIVITHSHPDHWFGLEYFQDFPIYALNETQQEIRDLGDMIIESKKPVLSDLVTDQKVVPTHVIQEGRETIDGLNYEFEKVLDAEAGVQLLIKIPEINTLVTQDLVYNHVHLFIGQGAFDGWVSAVNQIKNQDQFKTFLVGHGEPAQASVLESVLSYVEDAKQIHESVDSGEDLKAGLVDKYPTYRAPILLDISNSFLYQVDR